MTFKFPEEGTSYIYDTHIPGSSVLVTCANHGNEHMGVEIVKKLLSDEHFLGSIKNGKIGFLLLNPKAYQLKKRLVDYNMNRVRNAEGEGYEFARREEIKDFFIFNRFDYCIDIHTMSKPFECIGICDIAHVDIAKEILDVDQIRLDDVKRQGTFVGYFNSLGGIGFGLETGQHNDNTGIRYGITNILNILRYAGMIEETLDKRKELQGIYLLAKELHCNSSNFKYMQQFEKLYKLTPNEIIGRDGDTLIKNDLVGEIYFGLSTDTPIAGDGIGFLFRKIA